MGRITTRRPVVRISIGEGGDQDNRRSKARIDTLAVEEPLELRVGGETLAVTMRTPGADMELAAGFLLSEGVIRQAADIATMRYCAGTDDEGHQTYNLLDIVLAEAVAAPDPSVARNFVTTSSCGLCGAAGIEAVRRRSAYEVATDPLRVDPAVIAQLPATLRAAQSGFDRTGGLHAAGLFDAQGRLLCCREDVGRHNAVDKVVGWALQNGEVPARGRLLMVSGRASFELTQKAFMAGIPLLAAVSAPSSLAAELADEVGMTLLGFVRDGKLNGYAGASRVALPGSEVGLEVSSEVGSAVHAASA
jgi:FdhD protein